MAERRYTTEQLCDTERMVNVLANVPEDKKDLFIMITNSFIAGLEVSESIKRRTELWKKQM